MHRRLAQALLALWLASSPIEARIGCTNAAQQDGAPASAPTRLEPAAWSRHLPPDTFALVRAESVDALVSSVNAIATALGESIDFDAASFAQQVFGTEASWLDGERELVFAFARGDSPLEPVYLACLPSASPDRLVASLEARRAHCELVEGDYVIASSAPLTSAASAEPHPLALRLMPGTIAAQIDLEALLGQYRPVIDASLAEAEAAWSSGTAVVDREVERLLERVHELLDASEGLGLSLQRTGTLVELELRYTSTSEQTSGRGAAAFELGESRHLLDPAASCIAIANFDANECFSAFFARCRDLLQAFPGSARFDRSTSRELERVLGVLQSGLPFLGRLQAVSCDADSAGALRFALHTRGVELEQPFAELNAWIARVRTYIPFGCLESTHASERELGGRTVSQRQPRFRIGPTAQLAMAQMANDRKWLDAAERAEREWNARFDCVGARVSFASRDDEGFAATGEDDFVARALARTSATEARFAPEFERALERCAASETAFALRVDLARVLRELGALRSRWSSCFALDSSARASPAGAFTLTIWAAGTRAEARTGIALELEELRAFREAWRAGTAASATADARVPPASGPASAPSAERAAE